MNINVPETQSIKSITNAIQILKYLYAILILKSEKFTKIKFHCKY